MKKKRYSRESLLFFVQNAIYTEGEKPDRFLSISLIAFPSLLPHAHLQSQHAAGSWLYYPFFSSPSAPSLPLKLLCTCKRALAMHTYISLDFPMFYCCYSNCGCQRERGIAREFSSVMVLVDRCGYSRRGCCCCCCYCWESHSINTPHCFRAFLPPCVSVARHYKSQSRATEAHNAQERDGKVEIVHGVFGDRKRCNAGGNMFFFFVYVWNIENVFVNYMKYYSHFTPPMLFRPESSISGLFCFVFWHYFTLFVVYFDSTYALLFLPLPSFPSLNFCFVFRLLIYLISEILVFSVYAILHCNILLSTMSTKHENVN